MFKKLLVVLVAVFGLFTLASCGKRTYKADGVYLAFAKSDQGAPQITVVSVTIEKDKIKSFYIDCLQSTAVKNEEGVLTGYTFNAKTKKELGYAYRMHGQRELDEEAYKQWLKDNDKLEWFEQAELLEAYFVEHGTDLTTDENKKITNVAGVTIADSDYSRLAKQAVQNAIDGKVYAWTAYTSGSQVNLVWAEGTVNEKGKLTSLKLDTLQGNVKDGAFAWNAQTKQELGYGYRMHGQRELDEEAYKQWLKDNDKLEWFEQADLLAGYVLQNGLANVKLEGGKLAEDAPEAIAAVTITVSHYVEVFEELLEHWK